MQALLFRFHKHRRGERIRPTCSQCCLDSQSRSSLTSWLRYFWRRGVSAPTRPNAKSLRNEIRETENDNAKVATEAPAGGQRCGCFLEHAAARGSRPKSPMAGFTCTISWSGDVFGGILIAHRRICRYLRKSVALVRVSIASLVILNGARKAACNDAWTTNVSTTKRHQRAATERCFQCIVGPLDARSLSAEIRQS